MKFITLATLVTTTTALATRPLHHSHHHHHVNKRDVQQDGSIVTVYELQGQLIPAEQVAQGLKNGTLKLNNGKLAPQPQPHAHPEMQNSYEKQPAQNVQPVQKHQPAQTVDVDVSMVSKPTHAPKKHASNQLQKAPWIQRPSSHQYHPNNAANHTKSNPHFDPLSLDNSQSDGASYDSSSTGGVSSAFPDGQIDCSDFPSAYGALSVDWVGLGGWIGVQKPEMSAGGFSNILTVTPAICEQTGTCCAEGDFCSYACEPGYEKTQWPATQGATGQSVGGLQCKNGKLHLTNPSLSKTLCQKGNEAVSVSVKNTMSQSASICRTDYPGTESMTIPLDSSPGSTNPLTCPDSSEYFQWQDSMQTSGQYYVNNAGIPPNEACDWGTAAAGVGNFAPLNIGASYSNGQAWLSIFQNLPTTNEKLDFAIEIVGDDGGFDNMSGRCRYKNGQYCSGDDYTDCNAGTGCTVSVFSGSATFILSPA